MLSLTSLSFKNIRKNKNQRFLLGERGGSWCKRRPYWAGSGNTFPTEVEFSIVHFSSNITILRLDTAMLELSGSKVQFLNSVILMNHTHRQLISCILEKVPPGEVPFSMAPILLPHPHTQHLVPPPRPREAVPCKSTWSLRKIGDPRVNERLHNFIRLSTLLQNKASM